METSVGMGTEQESRIQNGNWKQARRTEENYYTQFYLKIALHKKLTDNKFSHYKFWLKLIWNSTSHLAKSSLKVFFSKYLEIMRIKSTELVQAIDSVECYFFIKLSHNSIVKARKLSKWMEFC